MPMQLHELHPSVIHAPLVLLPTAATVDLMAVTASGLARRRLLDAAGRKLWWVGVGAAALAGLAGLAASQEIRVHGDRARDAMWLHGMGNLGILLGAAGLAGWRSGHRATVASAALGAGAVGAALYTAWLGGELVYTHGAGVKAVAQEAASPRLLSAEAPWAFVRDVARGVAWLLGRGGRMVTHREPLARGAATRASDGPPVATSLPGSGFELRPS